MAVGVGIGLAAALALSQALTRVLYHVSGLDPAAYAAAGLTVAAIALSAMFWPARKAALLDATEVLRRD